MLTRDVRVDGFDASDFIALGELFDRAAPPPGGSDLAGGVVAIVDRGHLAKLFSTTSGRLPPTPDAVLRPLEALALEHRASWAIRVERSSLVEFSDRFGRRAVRGETFLAQQLQVLAVLRELAEEGGLETYPKDLRSFTVPRESTVLRVLDTVCPVGKTLLVAAFDGADVLTSLALHRAASGFDRIVGPAEIRRDIGLVSSDWTRNVAGLARAVELSVGSLALGCFAEARTFRELSRSTAPGAWTAAVASREIIFQPLAPALAIPLGVDVGRVALAVARDLATRLGVAVSPSGPLRPAIERALEFDPVAFLRELLGGR